jgi:hypothetical protein
MSFKTSLRPVALLTLLGLGTAAPERILDAIATF